MNVDFSQLTPTDEMQGEDPNETAELQGHLSEASEYLRSFPWCGDVKESYLGVGVGGVVALFLFRIQPNTTSVDEWLWVVVGDLPSAYFVTDAASTPADAINVYCDLMGEWLSAVRAGGRLTEVFPVAAEASEENAAMLESRVEFLREELLPTLA
jgi:hypothetical protein